jgi:hypothetical protein
MARKNSLREIIRARTVLVVQLGATWGSAGNLRRVMTTFDTRRRRYQREGPRLPRPIVHEIVAPRATPETSRPRLRSSTGRHGTSMKDLCGVISARLPA